MTTKLTAVEGWAQVFKTIIDECDPTALTEADGYVWRYVANQRKEIERLRAENAELRAALKGIVGNPENCLTFEGNLECRIYSTVDAYEAARKSIEDSEEPLDLGVRT